MTRGDVIVTKGDVIVTKGESRQVAMTRAYIVKCHVNDKRDNGKHTVSGPVARDSGTAEITCCEENVQ